MTIPDELRERLRSAAFPCPVMGCAGTITLDWDHEYGEFGAVLSSWPVFAGDCHDDDGLARLCARDAEEHDYPYHANHAAALNQSIEDASFDDGHVARLLGMSAERQTIARMLGVPR